MSVTHKSKGLVDFFFFAIFLLFAVSAKGQDSLVRPGEFEITSDMLAADLEGCSTVSVETVGGFNLFDPGFISGVCRFHGSGASVSQLEETVELFAKAQSRGLPAAQQTFASLAEGLSHCRIAKASLDALEAAGGIDDAAQTRFCKARKMASANFNDVDWSSAHFYYEEGSGRTVSKLVEELTQCLMGPASLQKPESFSCDEHDGVTTPQLRDLVEEETTKLLERFFDGSSGPLGRLLVEQKTLAESISTSAEEEINILREDADALADVVKTLQDHEQHQINPAMTFVEEYKSAYRTATMILDTRRRWSGGLLIDKANGDYDVSDDLTGSNGRSSELRSASANASRIGDDIASLETSIENLKSQRSAIEQKIRKLCIHYYCEIGAASLPGFGVEVRSTFDLSCKSPGMPSNRLCNAENQVLEAESTVPGLCESVGFPAKFSVLGLPIEQARECRRGFD